MSIHMSMPQFTKTSSTVALCSLASFVNSADRVIMPIAIIQLTDEFKWDMHGQGWVLSAFAVGFMSSMVCHMARAASYQIFQCFPKFMGSNPFDPLELGLFSSHNIAIFPLARNVKVSSMYIRYIQTLFLCFQKYLLCSAKSHYAAIRYYFKLWFSHLKCQSFGDFVQCELKTLMV